MKKNIEKILTIVFKNLENTSLYHFFVGNVLSFFNLFSLGQIGLKRCISDKLLTALTTILLFYLFCAEVLLLLLYHLIDQLLLVLPFHYLIPLHVLVLVHLRQTPQYLHTGPAAIHPTQLLGSHVYYGITARHGILSSAFFVYPAFFDPLLEFFLFICAYHIHFYLFLIILFFFKIKIVLS